MRSTRASAAVDRLNQRETERNYLMVITGNGQLVLRERIDGVDHPCSEPLGLDDFVTFVNSLGPQKAPRFTKNDATFAKQLVRKT